MIPRKIQIDLKRELIKLIKLLISLNIELKDEKILAKVEQIRHRIAHSEDRMNHLVYELYQLTPEEIKIVEDSTHE